MTTEAYPCSCGESVMLAPGCVSICCIDNGWAVNAVGDAVAPAPKLHPCECGKRMYLAPMTFGPCCMEARREARIALAAKEAAEAAEPGKPTYACVCGEFWTSGPGPAVLACCRRNGYSLSPLGGILHVPPELSSDILDSDPDTKGTTMTDTSTLPAAETIDPLRVVRGDHVDILTPRTGDQNTQLLERAGYNPTLAPFVQKARKSESTGVLGLYLEAVAHTAAGQPFNHLKFFVIGPNIYVYNRSAGETRANWRMRKEPTLHAALTLVQEAINKPQVKLFGHPVLVELQPDDLSAVESGAMPPARFRGEYRIQRDFGRYDFKMDVKSDSIPDRLVKVLTGGFVRSEDEVSD